MERVRQQNDSLANGYRRREPKRRGDNSGSQPFAALRLRTQEGRGRRWGQRRVEEEGGTADEQAEQRSRDAVERRGGKGGPEEEAGRGRRGGMGPCRYVNDDSALHRAKSRH